MKKRNGFVSNSSSSSFCIYGASVGDFDEIEEKIEKAGLESHFYFDEMYVGKSWSSIRDDETGAQFKKNIQDLLEEITGTKKECSTIEQSWFDG